MINKTQITVLNSNTILKQLLNQHAPLKTNYLTLHNETPWFNSKLNNLKVLFRKSCRLFTKSPSHSNLIDLQKNRYIYRNELKSTKTDYFTDKINICSHDYKRLYSITKTLLGKNKNSTLPHFPDDQLCKQFAEYFIDKINTICNRISSTYIRKPKHTPTHTYIHTPTHTRLHIPIHTPTHTYIHTPTHTRLHAYLYTYPHTPTYTYRSWSHSSSTKSILPAQTGTLRCETY